jgi:hypothetical protein
MKIELSSLMPCDDTMSATTWHDNAPFQYEFWHPERLAQSSNVRLAYVLISKRMLALVNCIKGCCLRTVLCKRSNASSWLLLSAYHKLKKVDGVSSPYVFLSQYPESFFLFQALSGCSWVHLCTSMTGSSLR